MSFTFHRIAVERAKFTQAERTFNRVLTQLDHDGFTLQIFSCEKNVVWDLHYGGDSAPGMRGGLLHAKPRRRPRDGKARAMHASGVLHFTSLLNRRRVTLVYGLFNSAAPH